MTTKINGTNTAASPAITGADTDTGLSFGSDTVNINTGGTTRATVDSAGRFLIGTTTEGDNLANNLTIADSANCGITLRGGTSSLSSIFFADGTGASAYVGQQVYNHADNSLKWIVNGSESMRIGGSDVMVGCTDNNSNSSTGIRLLGSGTVHATRNNEYSYVGRREGSDGGIMLFRRDSNNVGSISVTYSGTAFNTSSDYRLKENVTAISDGITRLKTLKPSRFNFKVNKDTTVDGFLAHEVSSIVPEAISGTKDKVASEDNKETGVKKGDPIYQQIDQSKLVPLLTAALQEAITKIETLETKVAALEAA
jgi:hypothetical protein